jgi:hypothetical protein
MKRIMTLACILAAVFGAAADTRIRQKHHADAFTVMGQTQPAKDYEGTLWFAEDRARNDMDNQSVIMRLDRGVIIILDHTKKTWTELPMDMSKAVARAAEESGEEAPAGMPADMQKMMEGMFKGMKFSVTETPEKAVINGWNCRKYIQKIEGGMAPSTSEVWASLDVKLDYTLMTRMSAAMMAMQPGLKDMVADIQKESEKIKGMAVRTVTVSTVMSSRMKSSIELLEVKNDVTPPAGIYEPPAGYKKVKGMQ